MLKEQLDKRIEDVEDALADEKRWEYIGSEYKEEAQKKLDELKRLQEILYGFI